MANHFRADNSCYHVVDYDPETGEVRKKTNSARATPMNRLGLMDRHGLCTVIQCVIVILMMPNIWYRQKKCITLFFGNKNLPGRFGSTGTSDAEDSGASLVDASAAACTASALYELSTYVTDKGV